MFRRQFAPAYLWRVGIAFIFLMAWIASVGHAAPYAALVMDARNGQVLHAENADTRLHPASLTKMMTLYVAFQAVENDEISLDTMVRVSRNAASEPPSRLGLKTGQKIKLRYLIRAAAIKSANDAATAIGEAIEGSEAAFARRMNRTAQALGMTRTTFKNAHGLTQSGHLSTARDMTILGRHLFYDYPAYYNLFSRRSDYAGVRNVNHTNSRFLSNYRGADGIKTGFTRAAGYNLTASAERGRERIITTVFGGKSTASRNRQVAKLMDLGFSKAPSRVALQKPKRPSYQATALAKHDPAETGGAYGRTVRLDTTPEKSLRPKLRPDTTGPILVANLDLKEDIEQALKMAKNVRLDVPLTPEVFQPETGEIVSVPAPKLRPAAFKPATVTNGTSTAPLTKVVSRVSTSDAQNWGISIGKYPSRYAAEKMLLKTALAEIDMLEGSLRKVRQNSRGFEATFLGLSQSRADQACKRLQSRDIDCSTLSPS